MHIPYLVYIVVSIYRNGTKTSCNHAQIKACHQSNSEDTRWQENSDGKWNKSWQDPFSLTLVWMSTRLKFKVTRGIRKSFPPSWRVLEQGKLIIHKISHSNIDIKLWLSEGAKCLPKHCIWFGARQLLITARGYKHLLHTLLAAA